MAKIPPKYLISSLINKVIKQTFGNYADLKNLLPYFFLINLLFYIERYINTATNTSYNWQDIAI